MDLSQLAADLKASSASQAIQGELWLMPTLQSLHLLAIAMLFTSALLLNLRIVGLVSREEPVLLFARRYVPWLWGGLVVLALTGATMVLAEPDRTLTNWVFGTKLALLAGAIVTSAALHVPLASNKYVWDVGRQRGLGVLLAGVSLILWGAIIVCGRWIAYAL